MMNTFEAFKHIVFDQHGEFRSGWRMLGFVMLSVLLGLTLLVPLSAAFPEIECIPDLAHVTSILVATFMMTRFVNRKPFGAAGLTIHPAMFRELGFGMLIGFTMIFSIFLVEVIFGFVSISWRGLSAWGATQVVLNSIFLFAIGAAAEELAFRGYLFQTMIQAMTFLPAAIIMSVLFALVHRLNPDATVFGLVNIGLAGIWFSIAYMKTRSLWLPIGLHWAWNFTQTTVFGYPCSGLDHVQRRLVDAVQHGPVWITGGMFGPEGGGLATIVLILGTGVVLKARVLSTPEGMITLDSLEDLLGPQHGPREESH